MRLHNRRQRSSYVGDNRIYSLPDGHGQLTEVDVLRKHPPHHSSHPSPRVPQNSSEHFCKEVPLAMQQALASWLPAATVSLFPRRNFAVLFCKRMRKISLMENKICFPAIGRRAGKKELGKKMGVFPNQLP